MAKNDAKKLEAFVMWFRSATPFIHEFGERTIVIAFGGEVLTDGEMMQLAHDINVLVSLEIRVVLVHGTRPQVEDQLKQHGVVSRLVDGRRVTDDAALKCVKEANGIVRMEIEATLSTELANSPMAGADIRVASGNFITAKPFGVRDGVDYMHTGQVRKVDSEGIVRRLDDDEVVLISPIGFSPTGDIFNCTLEDVATSVAIALKAEKLIFLTETLGVTDSKERLINELTALQAQEALNSLRYGGQTEDIRLFLPCAIRAVREGVKRAHLISRHIDGALLMELFTHHGIGTMVVLEAPDRLRDATLADADGIMAIIDPLVAQGILSNAIANSSKKKSTASWCWSMRMRLSVARRSTPSPTTRPWSWHVWRSTRFTATAAVGSEFSVSPRSEPKRRASRRCSCFPPRPRNGLSSAALWKAMCRSCRRKNRPYITTHGARKFIQSPYDRHRGIHGHRMKQRNDKATQQRNN